MPFDVDDPRATLPATATSGSAGAVAFAAAQFLPFTDALATMTALRSRTWVVRIQNAAVSYSDVAAGEVLTSIGDASERIIASTNADGEFRIDTDGDAVTLLGTGVVIVPPGKATIRCERSGVVLQVVNAAADDVLARALNAAAYAHVPPNVSVHRPDPSAETDTRIHLLSDHPADGARFGSIYRSTNLMLNFIDDRTGPRDQSKLSPHTHEDFEQCSIQLGGRFVHHVRTPWTPDMGTWREDEHVEIEGVGAVIFPPPLVHTSQAIGNGVNRLLDIFAPPRVDFLSKPGWVLNAGNYSL